MLTASNKRFIIPFAATSVLLIVAVFFIVWFRFDPGFLETRHSCLFSQTLHLYCPGCGGTRAVQALITGKPAAAAQEQTAAASGGTGSSGITVRTVEAGDIKLETARPEEIRTAQ